MFRNNPVFLLLAVLFGGVLAAPGGVAAGPAAPAFLVQIADTHVSAWNPELSSHTAALQNWVAHVNALPAPPAASVNLGDLVDDVNTSAEQSFALYFATVGALTGPHLTVPGNHDYFGLDQNGYDQFGYPTAAAGVGAGLWLVGSDVTNNGPIDFARLEAGLAAGAGRAPVVILQHYPLNAPDWLKCSGAPCTAPKWLLGASERAEFRRLAVKYDAYAVLGGHVHAGYATYDRATATDIFQTVVAPALFFSGGYQVLTAWGDRLAVAETKSSRAGAPVIVEPAYYDPATDAGVVYELNNTLGQPATRVRALTYGQPARALRMRIGVSTSPWFTMQPAADGAWEYAYNWTRMKANTTYQLTVEATYADGTTSSVTQNVRRASAYDAAPQVQAQNTALLGRDLSGAVTLQYQITDANVASGKAWLYIDGVNVSSSTYSTATRSYSAVWDTTAAWPGAHVIYLKVTDKFGRTVRSAREVFQVGAGAEATATPPPTATATPTATALPTATPTRPPLATLTWTPTALPSATPPPPAVTYCLGDRVWHDADRAGGQEPGESGLAGLTLHLLDATGRVLATTTTDSAGRYQFCGLAAGGPYQVELPLPTSGWQFSPADQGGDDALDSDFTPSGTLGRTPRITLPAADDLTWDAGLAPVPTPPAPPAPTSTPTGEPACQPGTLTLAPRHDTYIFKPGATKPGDSDPVNAALLRTGDAWPYYRALLHFDLTGLPPAATITSARLRLEVQSWYYPTGGKPTATLHWLARANSTAADWTSATATDPWAGAGASAADQDYRPAGAYSQQLVWGVNQLDVTRFLADGRDQANYGWRLTVTNSGATFYASETAGRGPQLTVSYACQLAGVPLDVTRRNP